MVSEPVIEEIPEGFYYMGVLIPEEAGNVYGILKLMSIQWPDITVDPARVQGWVDDALDGTGRTPDDIRDDIALHVITKARIMETWGVDEATADALIIGGNEGGMNFSDLPPLEPDGTPGTAPIGVPQGMRPGGVLIRIDGEDKQSWGMMYTVDGVNHIYTFDSEEAMKAALGENAAATFGLTVLTQDQIDDDDTMWVLGDAAGHAGQEQSYAAYWDDVKTEAALEAGIRNPGMLGRYLADPDIQRIIAEGEAGGWSEERIMAEIRNTEFYLEVLYPGIESILEAGLPNPEAQYNQYMQTVDGSLEALGYERDADGTFRTQIGLMLEQGIKADKFVGLAPTFIKAQNNTEFGAMLNAWTQKDLGVTLDFENWFDVMEGNTTPEINEVVQKAQIAYRAQQGKLGLSDDVINRIAAATDLNEVQINAAFTGTEQALFALGDRGLAITGLTIDDLISAPLDIAGASGLSPQEVRAMTRKVATELGVRDDPKATLFQSFSKRGTPVTPGQQALRPEAG